MLIQTPSLGSRGGGGGEGGKRLKVIMSEGYALFSLCMKNKIIPKPRA